MIKLILIIVTSIIFGFGFWYLIFWFITTEHNLFLWHWATKMVYLLLSLAATQGSIEKILNND
jgi:hypothetical protein